MQPKAIALGEIALNAALYSAQAGRQWRSVEDTTYNPVTSYRLRQPYASHLQNRQVVIVEPDSVRAQRPSGHRAQSIQRRRWRLHPK